MSTLTWRPRRVSSKSRWLLAGTVCGLALTTTASVAFACSNVMGPLTFSPASGPPGTVVFTTATGLKPNPAAYDLYFGGECMTFTGKLLKVITTNSQGGWTNVKVTIPKHATLGSHALCGIEAYPNPGQTATGHYSFTVV